MGDSVRLTVVERDTSETVRPAPAARNRMPSETGRPDRTAQALDQQAATFDRSMQADRALGLQARVMGWLLIPGLFLALVLAVLVDPLAAVAAAPVTGLAAWYWRGVLRRFLPPLRPTSGTPPSASPAARDRPPRGTR